MNIKKYLFSLIILIICLKVQGQTFVVEKKYESTLLAEGFMATNETVPKIQLKIIEGDYKASETVELHINDEKYMAYRDEQSNKTYYYISDDEKGKYKGATLIIQKYKDLIDVQLYFKPYGSENNYQYMYRGYLTFD